MDTRHDAQLMLILQIPKNQLLVIDLKFVTGQQTSIKFHTDQFQLLSIQLQYRTLRRLALNIQGAGHFSDPIVDIKDKISVHSAVIWRLVIG